MRIKVEFDTRALRTFTAKQRKRLAFNTAQALNATAKKIQTAERVNLDRKFTIRKAGFMYRLVKITAFASARASRAYAEIAIDPSKRGVLLGLLEKGGVKEPERGGSVAVPLTGGAARPSFGQAVPTQLWFQRLRFRRHTTKTGKTQFKGALRTFLIPGLGVLQRGAPVKTQGRKTFLGRGGSKLRNTTLTELIYHFARGPRLKPVLEFARTATDTFARTWAEEFAKAYRRQ